MISRLRGRVTVQDPSRIVVDVAGVGYDVQIPLSTFYEIHGRLEREVSLHVHTHVREDAFLLYGFATPGEKATFEKLIAISGVGPKMALAVLSGIGPEELRAAVLREDRGRLQKIPGVGKKTAERMLLELRDKWLAPVKEGVAGAAVAPAGTVRPLGDQTREDAISALVNLGYSRDAATTAVERAQRETGDDAPIEQLLRTSLSGLGR